MDSKPTKLCTGYDTVEMCSYAESIILQSPLNYCLLSMVYNYDTELCCATVYCSESDANIEIESLFASLDTRPQCNMHVAQVLCFP